MVYVPPLMFWGFDDANQSESYTTLNGACTGRYQGRSATSVGGARRAISQSLGPLDDLGVSGNAPQLTTLNVLDGMEVLGPEQPPSNATWSARDSNVQALAPDGNPWTLAKLNATQFGVRAT